MAPVRVQEAAGESGFCWLACPFGRRQSSPAGLLQCGNAAPRRARARDRSRLRHRAGALEEPRRAQRGDQHADREEEHRPLVTELTKRRRCAQWPDLFDRPDVRVRTSSAIAQDVPNTENRNIRLVGQPVTLSRTAAIDSDSLPRGLLDHKCRDRFGGPRLKLRSIASRAAVVAPAF
jgi:hypothetical protein